jgi:PPOX class probable F420-dependent enzyme
LVDREALLAGRRIAVLATTNADGSPYPTAIWYVWTGEAFLMPTSGASRKARNVHARPDASIVVEERAPGLAGVAASGRAEVLRGEEAAELNTRIHARYLTPLGREHPQVGALLTASDDVTIRLVPERWRTWDMRSAFRDLFEDRELVSPLDP